MKIAIGGPGSPGQVAADDKLHLTYKRLERERFHWPRTSTQSVLTLTGEQLNWLLDGYDVWRMRPHEALYFSVFS